MTTYSTISNGSLAVGAVPSSSVVTALRDNPIAISEAASGAPINVCGWHPYDKVTVGDGKDGIIYDFGVSGAVSTIISPDFEDGYEYRFFGNIQDASGEVTMTVDAYREVAADYVSTASLTCEFFDFVFPMTRLAKKVHFILGARTQGGTSAAATIALRMPTTSSSTARKILRARFSISGTLTAGKVWMMRRREYATDP